MFAFVHSMIECIFFSTEHCNFIVHLVISLSRQWCTTNNSQLIPTYHKTCHIYYRQWIQGINQILRILINIHVCKYRMSIETTHSQLLSLLRMYIFNALVTTLIGRIIVWFPKIKMVWVVWQFLQYRIQSWGYALLQISMLNHGVIIVFVND